MGWKIRPPIFPRLNSILSFVFLWVGEGGHLSWGCDWYSDSRRPDRCTGAASGGVESASGGVDATRRHAPWADFADAAVHRDGARVALDGRHAPDAEHALVLRGDRCARA